MSENGSLYDDEAFRRAALQTVRANKGAFELISARLRYDEADAVQEILVGVYPFIVRLFSQSRPDGSPRTLEDVAKACRGAMKKQLYKMLERSTEQLRSPPLPEIGIDCDLSSSDYEAAMALAADACERLGEAQSVLRDLTEAAERLGIWNQLTEAMRSAGKLR